MARLKVTGVDAFEKNIKVANLHSKSSGLKINYVHGSPEKLTTSKKFDVILNLEIVEHVDNVDLYISSCFNLLKNNGLMFTATLNRTFISYVKAIIGAEYIFKMVADWNT